MSNPTQTEAHLVVAAIRVLQHKQGRAPRPEEVAEFLDLPPAVLRMQVVSLQDLGIIALVESAFDNHVEIRDHRLIEDLEVEVPDGDLREDLADFDRRKQEEAAQMEQLFADGDHQKKKSKRLQKMADDLADFPRKKKGGPAGGPDDPFSGLD